MNVSELMISYVPFVTYKPESLNHYKIPTTFKNYNTIQINVVLDLLISFPCFAIAHILQKLPRVCVYS
jgi:hypothetical protein